jgi:hypothetical protein
MRKATGWIMLVAWLGLTVRSVAAIVDMSGNLDFLLIVWKSPDHWMWNILGFLFNEGEPVA